MLFRLFLALQIVFATIAPAPAQEIQSDHCLHGCPSGSPATNKVIIREIYILSANGTTKFADWVAYKVTAETIRSTGKTKRKWKADPLLAENETNLQEAKLVDAKGLTALQVKLAKNWKLAFYSDDFLKELGLPPDHNKRVKKKLAEMEMDKKATGGK